jgi:hypothetical protein
MRKPVSVSIRALISPVMEPMSRASASAIRTVLTGRGCSTGGASLLHPASGTSAATANHQGNRRASIAPPVRQRRCRRADRLDVKP